MNTQPCANHMPSVTLDRFEGDWAVLLLDDGRVLDVLRTDLPADCREGDRLHYTEGRFLRDPAATEERKSAMADKLAKLLGR